jgi:hypothetical protein
MPKTIFFNKLWKNSNQIYNQMKEKKHLQANGFKGLKNTFTNNGV